MGLVGTVEHVVIDGVEAVLGLLLVAEDLDHLLAVDHLLDIAVQGAQGALLAIQPLNITGVVRTSVHYFTSKADIDALLNGLKDMLK